MKERKISELWEELVNRDLFTREELQLLTNINGYSMETLNNAIFSRFGYRDYEQMMGEEYEE